MIPAASVEAVAKRMTAHLRLQFIKRTLPLILDAYFRAAPAQRPTRHARPTSEYSLPTVFDVSRLSPTTFEYTPQSTYFCAYSREREPPRLSLSLSLERENPPTNSSLLSSPYMAISCHLSMMCSGG